MVKRGRTNKACAVACMSLALVALSFNAVTTLFTESCPPLKRLAKLTHSVSMRVRRQNDFIVQRSGSTYTCSPQVSHVLCGQSIH